MASGHEFDNLLKRKMSTKEEEKLQTKIQRTMNKEVNGHKFDNLLKRTMFTEEEEEELQIKKQKNINEEVKGRKFVSLPKRKMFTKKEEELQIKEKKTFNHDNGKVTVKFESNIDKLKVKNEVSSNVLKSIEYYANSKCQYRKIGKYTIGSDILSPIKYIEISCEQFD